MKSHLIAIVAAVLLVGCGNPDGALLKAIQEGKIKAVKQAIADGADVNAKSKFGRTPLHSAADPGRNKEIVELLIAEGADVHAKTKSGTTSLALATVNGHNETVVLLRKHGAKTVAELKAESK